MLVAGLHYWVSSPNFILTIYFSQSIIRLVCHDVCSHHVTYNVPSRRRVGKCRWLTSLVLFGNILLIIVYRFSYVNAQTSELHCITCFLYIFTSSCVWVCMCVYTYFVCMPVLLRYIVYSSVCIYVYLPKNI